MKIYVDGREYTPAMIHRWEMARLPRMRRILARHTHRPCPATTPVEFATYKAALSPFEMKRAFRRSSALIAAVTRLVVALSGSRRKISVAEFDLDFCDARTLHRAYFDMMLNNTPANVRCSLGANPEHFLLRGTGDHEQEVLEISGGIPLPVDFVIDYDNENGVVSAPEPDYPWQAYGVSRLPGGPVIGAVRHQMKDTATGCHVKLMVEFPALMSDRNIRAHQDHLACEFYHWFSEIEQRMSND